MRSALNLSNPTDLLTAQVKLRACTDGTPVMWWMKGVQYGVVDLTFKPLYNMLNGSFQRMVQIDENAFAVTMLEICYFTDLDTGELLKEFVNPYTNAVCETPPAVFGPNHVKLTTGGIVPPEDFPFGTLKFDGSLGPAVTDNDDLWIREESLVRMESDNPGFGNYIYNELVNYKGSLSAVSDDDVSNAAATLNYHTTSNWRPWMQAGDTSGHICSQAIGKKIASVDEFPENYLAIAKKEHPEIIANPVQALDAPPTIPAG
jgi:hypothetical protein